MIKVSKFNFSLIFIFLIIFILVFNYLNYDPKYGYDSEAHYEYVEGFFALLVPNLSDQASDEITREFFNPPLPYALPATFSLACRSTIDVEDKAKYCQTYYGKIIQITNSLLYLLTLYFYLLTFKFITKGKLLNLNVLLPISLLAVNYKTFSMLRGEPYIVFINSVLIFLLSKYLDREFNLKKKDFLIFGLFLGLIGLSRQWAFLLFPAYGYFLFYQNNMLIKKRVLKFLIYVFSIAFILCSWVYFKLYFEFGSFTAFNMDPTDFNLINQPLDFYLLGKDEIRYLFTKPIRPNLGNNLLGILYSDLWGDYWGYFVFTSKYLDIGRNQLLIGDYLARVNIVSLVPTFLIFVGFFKSKKVFIKTNLKKFIPLLTFIKLSAISSIMGYLWFLIKYPEIPQSGTIKASYMVQFFHLLTLPLMFYLDYLNKTKTKAYLFVSCLLLIVFAHNFSTYLSHF
jgi:hypothetical protein